MRERCVGGACSEASHSSDRCGKFMDRSWHMVGKSVIRAGTSHGTCVERSWTGIGTHSGCGVDTGWNLSEYGRTPNRICVGCDSDVVKIETHTERPTRIRKRNEVAPRRRIGERRECSGDEGRALSVQLTEAVALSGRFPRHEGNGPVKAPVQDVCLVHRASGFRQA